MEIQGDFNRVAGRDYYDVRLSPEASELLFSQLANMEMLTPREKALLYHFRSVGDARQASILAILADIALLWMLENNAANDD
ncbi:hypothetical protein [Nitrincola iocasae]|uniref:Uncharacterized protein n=1 Tax=Nitrincola iocasae TaxID=2614693 RepID=A0A5J6LAR6_9GAMM|nr:hypothetical protein [Nitrincola iocasae]QEW05633.1 hypothetical protein F5I99_03535 [Nitrincola iocasae]